MFDEITADKSGQDTQRLAPARAFYAPDELVLADSEIARNRPGSRASTCGTGGAGLDDTPRSITLVLPYPISANAYWGTRVIKTNGRWMSITYVTHEARAYKLQVARLAQAAGISKPILGRVQIDVRLWPARPQDWAKRYAQDPFTWDDTVRCLDLDNANKVLLDALKGIALDDDKWVRRMTSERMQPDDGGARVAVRITPLVVVKPQGSLL